MSTAIARQRDPRVEQIEGTLATMREDIQRALPAGIDPERFERLAVQAVESNPYLLELDQRSLYVSVMSAAQLGLELDPVLGQGYLVPYKGKVQFQPGYKGLVELARNSGEIEHVWSEIVYENDEIEVRLGDDKRLIHKPVVFGDRGAPVGTYAVAKFTSGLIDFEIMTREEVLELRERSPSYQSAKKKNHRNSPWITDPKQMWRKCPIRRLAARLPLSSRRFRMAVALEEMHDQVGKSVSVTDAGLVVDDDVIDVEATDVADEGASQTASALDDAMGAEEEDPRLTRGDIEDLYAQAKQHGFKTKSAVHAAMLEAAGVKRLEDIRLSHVADIEEKFQEVPF